LNEEALDRMLRRGRSGRGYGLTWRQSAWCWWRQPEMGIAVLHFYPQLRLGLSIL